MATGPSTLVDLLRRRADVRPEADAVVYLGDGEEIKDRLTFGDLDVQARAIAARLQGLGATGQCAVLVYPPGVEFLAAFFGCFYANVIPVPLPLPHSKGTVAQFPGILADLDARTLLTTATTMTRLRRMDLQGVDALVCLNTEETNPELARAWRPCTPSSSAVAYLQYTSGSTANRKGVMITHDNVIAHLTAMAACFGHHDASVGVNWLPHTHDLGLVSGILQPLFHGHLNVLMSANAFVQQPIRWLNAITRFRGTYANSPNFGYDHCLRRTTPEQRARLDLRSWEVALNGAEPVHQQTLDRFAAMFEPWGFRRTVMYPAYGLAEATLMISGGVPLTPRSSIRLDADALEQNRIVESTAGALVRTLVGCGGPLLHTHVRIVDPVSCEESPADRVGEIWARGPGITAGYWRRPDENEQTFRGRIAGDPSDDVYLRTGDLGFMRGGELYITGRWKDLVIIRGANHYPQDIEWTVEQSHPAFRPGCGGAFSLESDDGEKLVVVYELEREYLRSIEPEELLRIARRAVAEEHDLHLDTLVLLKTGTVPRTTSGKIQRRKCRSDFLDGALAEVWRSSKETIAEEVAPIAVAATADAHRDGSPAAATAADVVGWLREYAGERLNSRLMDERRSIAPHVILDFGNHGVLGLQVPRAMGGLGLGHAGYLDVIQQIGAIDPTLAMMTVVHNSLGIWPILHHADAALCADLVPRLASGRELVAFAITEPAAGSNPQAIVSTATPDGDDAWRLNGTKCWSGTAGWASVINVFAQNVAADGTPSGVSGFVVPRSTRGLVMGPEALTLGMRGMVQNTIHLEGARVTRLQCLGLPGGGMQVARAAMQQGRLAIGAACIGGIKRCLQLLLRYAERRTISTGRLLDNPVLLDRVAALTSAVAGLDALVSLVAQRLDAGADVPEDLLIVCKIAGSEWFWRAADDLVQFLGGRGYVETNVAAQLLRDARVTRILEGPTEALEMFLGSRVVNDGEPLHRFLRADLAASDVSSRLAAAVSEIEERCTRGATEDPDARRWACALAGRIAVDAVLLAANAYAGDTNQAAQAGRRFDRAVALALDCAAQRERPSAVDAQSTIDRYTAAIGDVDQSLAGEDQAPDAMIRRTDRTASPRASAIVAAPPRGTEESVRRDAVPRGESALAAAGERSTVPTVVEPARSASVVSAAEIERFIVRRVAASLKMRESSIDPTRTLFDYGVDSVTTVMLVASLEDWLGVTCNPETVYDVPIIRRFAAHIASQQQPA